MTATMVMDSPVGPLELRSDGAALTLLHFHDEAPAQSADNGESDCTFMVSADDLIRMVNGQLNAANASMQGRLRVAGDSRLALMLGPILLGT